jgi:hypothetical protein
MTSTVNPWAPAIPYLQNFLGGLGAPPTVSPGQNQAFSELENWSAQGNPWTQSIANVANKEFGFKSNAPAIATANNALLPYAQGAYLDPMKNPYTGQALSTLNQDISNQINGEFAGAGRSLSPGNSQALARGLSQGEGGLLMNQYNQNVGNQFAAAGALTNAAGAEQGLNQSALGINAQGTQGAQNYLQARDYAPNTLLNLYQQQKMLPYTDLAGYESLLLPVAGMGRTSTQQGATSTSGSQSGMQVGFNSSAGASGGSGGGGGGGTLGTGMLGGLFGSGGLGGLFSMFSDERVKDNIQQVGKTNDGQKIYKYSYKGDPTATTHLGLLAQEVEKKHPEAVGQVNGIKTVNYDKATGGLAGFAKGKK